MIQKAKNKNKKELIKWINTRIPEKRQSEKIIRSSGNMPDISQKTLEKKRKKKNQKIHCKVQTIKKKKYFSTLNNGKSSATFTDVFLYLKALNFQVWLLNSFVEDSVLGIKKKRIIASYIIIECYLMTIFSHCWILKTDLKFQQR